LAEDGGSTNNRQKVLYLQDLGANLVLKKWSSSKFFAITKAAAKLGEQFSAIFLDAVELLSRRRKAALAAAAAGDQPAAASAEEFKARVAQLVKSVLATGDEGAAFVLTLLVNSVEQGQGTSREVLEDLSVDDTLEVLCEVVEQNFTERTRKNLTRLQGSIPAIRERVLGAAASKTA
jgi:hypothetical protein